MVGWTVPQELWCYNRNGKVKGEEKGRGFAFDTDLYAKLLIANCKIVRSMMAKVSSGKVNMPAPEPFTTIEQ
jgi:hypothetical protein